MEKVLDERIQGLILDHYQYTALLRPYLSFSDKDRNRKRYADSLHDRAITSIEIASGYRELSNYNPAIDFIHGAINDATAAMSIYDFLGNNAKQNRCLKMINACRENLVTLEREYSEYLSSQIPTTPVRDNDDGYTTSESPTEPLRAQKPKAQDSGEKSSGRHGIFSIPHSSFSEGAERSNNNGYIK
jgi:hypothetical protein